MSIEKPKKQQKEKIADNTNSTPSFEQLMDAAAMSDVTVFNHIDTCTREEVEVLIDKYLDGLSKYLESHQSIDREHFQVALINLFKLVRDNTIDESYHEHIARKTIQTGPDYAEGVLAYHTYFSVDYTFLIQSILSKHWFDMLRNRYEKIPPHCRSYLIKCLIEQKNFSITERKVQVPPWEMLIQEVTSAGGSPWFTHNVIFVDEHGKQVDIGALLPEGWGFVRRRRSQRKKDYGSCNHESKIINYTERSSLLVFLHELGHVYDSNHNQEGYFNDPKERMRAERFAWAWTLQKVRELKRQGITFPEYAKMREEMYAALHTHITKMTNK